MLSDLVEMKKKTKCRHLRIAYREGRVWCESCDRPLKPKEKIGGEP